MAQTIGDFFDLIGDGSKPEFRPEPWYNAVGDCIHYHWMEDEFYAERIDDKLTVYRSTGTGDAVGCEIKGVRALQQKLGDFGIHLNEQDGTPLAMFVFASHTMGKSSDENAANREKTYKYLLEQVGKQRVAVEPSPC